MTGGSVRRQIVRFALPIFWGNLFQQLYNIVDSLVVGNFLGSDALAAVGSSGNIIFLLVGLFGGLFTGASVVISGYFGAQDHERMHTAIHTTVAFGLLAGVILSIVGVVILPSFCGGSVRRRASSPIRSFTSAFISPAWCSSPCTIPPRASCRRWVTAGIRCII